MLNCFLLSTVYAFNSWEFPILYSVLLSPVWPILIRVMILPSLLFLLSLLPAPTCFCILYKCLPVSLSSQYACHTDCAYVRMSTLASALLNGTCKSTCFILRVCLARISTFWFPSTPTWTGTQIKPVKIPISFILYILRNISLIISILTNDLRDLILSSDE